MSDLNILRMMTGKAPGYTAGLEMWAQRLLVVLMASETKDVGRMYGGELAALPGNAVMSEDALELQITSSIPDALVWMKRNEAVPDNLTATVESVVIDNGRATVALKVSLDEESTTVSATL